VNLEGVESPPRGARSGGMFAGPLVVASGIATLLEAMDLFPGTRIRVVGSGPARARLEAHPRIALHGPLGPTELHERMRSALYLVLPSLACERQPSVLLEAFSNGLPVIASRLPAIAELVEAGRNGLLFDPGCARELARRLAWAEAFPEKMRQMGECARADYEARCAGAAPPVLQGSVIGTASGAEAQAL
jgi:glycosyltransferase involved in cell wall biosynthesis